jgi:hypothetical protein
LDPGLGGNLIEGKVALDKTFGHLTYGCLTCCGSTPYLSPGTLGLGVGGDGFIGAMGNNNCTGATVNLQTYFSSSTARWWSGNTSTATVTSFKGHGVAPGATNGLATATVPSGDGGVPKSPCPKLTQEGTNNVKVQVPTSLSVLNVTVLPNGQGLNFGCSGLANYGIKVDIKYQVLDQYGSPILSANMTPHEHGTSFGGSPYDNPIGPSGFTNSTATTAADGTFHDVPFGVCANGAFSSLTATQFITMIMPDGSAPSVRGQTVTATGQSAGHGTLHNSVGDISATR